MMGTYTILWYMMAKLCGVANQEQGFNPFFHWFLIFLGAQKDVRRCFYVGHMGDDMLLDFIWDLLDILNLRYWKRLIRKEPAFCRHSLNHGPRGSKFHAQVHAEPRNLGFLLWKSFNRKPQNPEKNGKLCDSNDWKNPHLEENWVNCNPQIWGIFCLSKWCSTQFRTKSPPRHP